MSIPLAALEEIIDASGIAPRVEALLPIGVRHRQLRVRTLLAGMLLSQADHRPAHLTRVRDALTALPAADQVRLGVTEDWKTGPHLLTYRQTERTFGLVTGALAKDVPDGLPSGTLAAICDDLLEASIPDEHKQASSALAVDWTDVETFSRPPPHGTSDCADPEASWGHRKGGGPGQDSELFFGYYASAATMMREEHGPAVPELARRMTVLLLPCRPGPRPGPGADRDARGRHPARRHTRRFRVRPPRRRGLGHPAPPGRGAAGPGPAPLRPRPQRHPPRRHHRQRQPLLPGHTPAAAGTRPARPRRHPGRNRRARHPDSRAGPLQARAHHQRRPRRLPPGDVPRRHGQDPLPATPGVNDPGPAAAGDPHPARAPAGLLRPADHHGATRDVAPRPRKSTTTPRRRTGGPTPGAPAPSGPSPPPRTPPATTSPAAGPG